MGASQMPGGGAAFSSVFSSMMAKWYIPKQNYYRHRQRHKLMAQQLPLASIICAGIFSHRGLNRERPLLKWQQCAGGGVVQILSSITSHGRKPWD